MVNENNKVREYKNIKEFEILYMLSEIAILGGIYKFITIKTGELGEKLGYSQQSMSRKINELFKEGFVEKVVLIRGLKIKITKKGMDYLMEGIKRFSKINEMIKEIVLKGYVTSGMGEGTYYMTREGYLKQFRDMFGEEPYPGTLNIIVENATDIVSFLKNNYRYILKGFRERDRTFGDVIVHRGRIGDFPCYIIFPERGHYENVVEIVSPENLRKKFSLKDGDEVILKIFPYD
ncbi:MAG: DUF120 domain-containing protein [Thermoplasmata archaeon]|nr:DUF120 domain-containing protein [Euryarchaeota archaeon]MVT35278.1 DUF120 domain-containing protein [Euryarchaeota archaeon]